MDKQILKLNRKITFQISPNNTKLWFSKRLANKHTASMEHLRVSAFIGHVSVSGQFRVQTMTFLRHKVSIR